MKTTENWDKIRKQVVEKPNLEDNANFLQRLVIENREQMGGNNCFKVKKFGCENLGRYDWLIKDYKLCSIA